MQKDLLDHPIVSAAEVFAATFLCCTVVLPTAGLVVGVYGPDGLNWVAETIGIPIFAFWIGDLRIGQGADTRFLPNSDGYHAIPLVVWLVTWVVFAWAASGFGGWRRVAAAIVVIAAVTVGMHGGLRLLGIQLLIPNL